MTPVIDKCKIGWNIDRSDIKSLMVLSLYTGRMEELTDTEQIEKAKNQLLNKKTLKTISYDKLIRIPSEKIAIHKNRDKTLYVDTYGHIRLLDNELICQYSEMGNLGNMTTESEIYEDLLLEVLDRSLLVKKYSNGNYELDNTVCRIKVKNLMILKDSYKHDLSRLDSNISDESDYVKVITTLIIPFNNAIQLMESILENDDPEDLYDNILQFARQLHKMLELWLTKPETRDEIDRISKSIVIDIMYLEDTKIRSVVTKLDYMIYNINQIYK